jgi:hypothetical protein
MGAVARMVLGWRHHKEVVLFGLYWKYCGHRSHRWNLPCWSWSTVDGHCAKHTLRCWGEH